VSNEAEPRGGNRRGSPNQRRGQSRAGPPKDFWRDDRVTTPPDPITPVDDPTALLRSLGRSPLPGPPSSDYYLAAVVVRASALATALAAAADIVGDRFDDAG
jgi:hypothetical protein